MASGEPRVPVSVLRNAVREAIATTSSRSVARDLGISAPAVNKFVAGSEPRESTIRKLTAWYIRHRQQGGDATLDSATAHAAIAFLLEHIPPQRRNDVRAALLQLIESKGTQAGASAPAWLKAMRRHEQ